MRLLEWQVNSHVQRYSQAIREYSGSKFKHKLLNDSNVSSRSSFPIPDYRDSETR